MSNSSLLILVFLNDRHPVSINPKSIEYSISLQYLNEVHYDLFNNTICYVQRPYDRNNIITLYCNYCVLCLMYSYRIMFFNFCV